MNQTIDGRWPIALLGLAVTLLGAWTMYQEAMPNFAGGRTAIARLAAAPDSDVPLGLTVRSQHSALLDCEMIFRSSRAIEMQYLLADEQDRLVSLCGQMADAVIAQSPQDAFGWFIRAAASAATGDMAGFNDAMLRSQLTGPNEGWLASMRVGLAEAHLASLDQATSDANLHDLQVVASTYIYAPTLARRFVADDDFRTRMTSVLETMPPADQRRFLSAVRAILTATGR